MTKPRYINYSFITNNNAYKQICMTFIIMKENIVYKRSVGLMEEVSEAT